MRVKVTSARDEFAEIIRLSRAEPVTITRHGEAVAVVISPNDLAELQRLRGLYGTIPKRCETALAFHQ